MEKTILNNRQRCKRYFSIIPARSGSKRLPGKNGLDFLGLPLFGWTIRASLSCPEIDKTIFSTDSPDYRVKAIELGADCPELRPKELASDKASSSDVVLDIIENPLRSLNDYDGFVLLQPTSPLRTSEDISKAIRMHSFSNAPAVVSVCETECPMEWTGRLNKNNAISGGLIKKVKRSQDCRKWVRLNGAIYILDLKIFKKEKTFLPKGTLAYVMPRERSIDVDTSLDFEFAKYLMGRK